MGSPQTSEVKEWSGAGYETHCTFEKEPRSLEITFSTVGGKEVNKVDRTLSGMPWKKTPTGMKQRERFVYQDVKMGFRAEYTMKGPVQHCYVAAVSLTGLEEKSGILE